MLSLATWRCAPSSQKLSAAFAAQLTAWCGCLLQEAVRALRECVQAEPEHEWAQDELADLERMLEEEHASKEAPKDEQPPTDL